MHVTFRQLQLFLALAETGSVTATARACLVTQPTVSMQIKALAYAIGEPLYEHVARRLHLTPAGEALRATAQAMSDEWSAFAQTLAALRGATRGKLRLAIASTAKYFVPGLLGSFCARHPEVDIALEVLNRDGVVARLRANRDDLYVMSHPPGDVALVRHAFMPNPLVLVAARSHPLAKAGPHPLALLRHERFVLREAGSGTRMAVDAHFAKQRFVPDIRLELGSNEAVRLAAAAGLGIGVLSRHALAGGGGDAAVAELDVRGFPLPTRWYALHPRGRHLAPIAEAFLAHLVAARPTPPTSGPVRRGAA